MITALGVYSSAGLSQAADQTFLVGIELDKTLTIQANNATLKDILLEIETLTGIPVNFVSENTQRISVDIENQPIEDAIRKLTPNYMIMRNQLNGEDVINEIIIISDDPAAASSAGGSSFLPSGQPAPVIIIEDETQPDTAPENEPPQSDPIAEPPFNQDTPTANN